MSREIHTTITSIKLLELLIPPILVQPYFHLSLHPTWHASVHHCLFHHRSIPPSIHWSIYAFIPVSHLCIHLTLHPLIHISIYQSIYPSIYSSIINPAILSSIFYSFTHLSIQLSNNPSILSLIHPSFHLSPIINLSILPSVSVPSLLPLSTHPSITLRKKWFVRYGSYLMLCFKLLQELYFLKTFF